MDLQTCKRNLFP